MAWRVPPSFVKNGPKLRVLIIVKWHKPETAKNRGQPPKMTHSLETEFFWGGGLNGKVVAPGILGKCPVDKNCNYHTNKLTFSLKYPNFWVKKAIFVPSGQLEPHWSMFSTRKRCLNCSLIWKYQKFYSIPPKKWILSAHLVPCWWVVWWLWRAGCISQDTYLPYVYRICKFHVPWGR